MGEAVGEYPRRVYEYGTATTTYLLSFDNQGHLLSQKISGPVPADSPSGDIVLLLDWNPYSGKLLDTVGLGGALSTV